MAEPDVHPKTKAWLAEQNAKLKDEEGAGQANADGLTEARAEHKLCLAQLKEIKAEIKDARGRYAAAQDELRDLKKKKEIANDRYQEANHRLSELKRR